METIQYKSGYKYQLTKSYTVDIEIKPPVAIELGRWIRLCPSGSLYIADGYAWDGASGPAIDTKTIMRGALVHDALYQLMREKLLSTDYFYSANRVLHTICLEDGMHWLRAWYVKRAVDIWGLAYAS